MTNPNTPKENLSLQERLEQTEARIEELRQELRQTEAEASRLRDEIAREMPTLGYAVIYELQQASRWVRDEIMALTNAPQEYGGCQLSVKDGQMLFLSPSYSEGPNQCMHTAKAEAGEDAYDYDSEIMARFTASREEAEAQPEVIEEDEL